MIGRRVLLLGALACVMLVTSSCDGSPRPIETSAAPFATEEEAFAAAEETYRAYVDALNNVDLADPETFEPVYALTTGDANAADRKSFTQMAAAGWTVSGSTEVISFVGTDFQPPAEDASVTASACIDVASVELTDASGVSQVNADRPPRYALVISFVERPSSEFGLAIASSENVESDLCGTE